MCESRNDSCCLGLRLRLPCLANSSPCPASAPQANKDCTCACGRVMCFGACQTRSPHAHPNPPANPDQALEYLREGNKVSGAHGCGLLAGPLVARLYGSAHHMVARSKVTLNAGS